MRLSGSNYFACLALIAIGTAVTLIALKPKCVEPIKVLSDIEVAQARVADSGKTYTSGDTGVTSYHFRYSFEIDGTTYSGDSPFGHRPKEIEPIQYMASDPWKNSPELAGHAYIDLIFFSIPMGFTLVMITVLIAHHCSSPIEKGASEQLVELERASSFRSSE